MHTRLRARASHHIHRQALTHAPVVGAVVQQQFLANADGANDLSIVCIDVFGMYGEREGLKE